VTSAFYDDLKIHEVMLRDDIRNQAYRRAIFANVRKGDVVLDVGAGTGILSLFAAQAGARTVYAVERTTIADLARRIVIKNGYGDRIEVIQSDLEAVRLPQRVDVIVSEWLFAY
jgi:predicted RNA methylase